MCTWVPIEIPDMIEAYMTEYLKYEFGEEFTYVINCHIEEQQKDKYHRLRFTISTFGNRPTLTIYCNDPYAHEEETLTKYAINDRILMQTMRNFRNEVLYKLLKY